MIISMVHKKKIIKYINDNFNQKPTCLDKYILDNSEEILYTLNNEYDEELICVLGDSNNKEYYKFIKLFDIELKKNNNLKIEIYYEPPFYYIRNTPYGDIVSIDKRKILYDKFKYVFSRESKGMDYEQFCRIFLQDLGVEAIKPKNDNGIDIIGKVKINYNNEFLRACKFNDYINILAQVKCHKKEICTTVLKDLVANSQMAKYKGYNNIGYRPTLLVVFSYSGFNKEAVKFAEKHEIYLVDNDMILDLLSGNNKEFKCIKYIQKLINDKKR